MLKLSLTMSINQAKTQHLEFIHIYTDLILIWPGLGLWTGTWPRACQYLGMNLNKSGECIFNFYT